VRTDQIFTAAENPPKNNLAEEKTANFLQIIICQHINVISAICGYTNCCAIPEIGAMITTPSQVLSIAIHR